MMWLINNGKGSNPVSSHLDPSDPHYGSPTGTLPPPSTPFSQLTTVIDHGCLTLVASSAGNGGADMSPQQICDCTGVSCCSGGWPETALQYVQLNGGLSRWADYPYTANVNVTQCKPQSTRVAAQVHLILSLQCPSGVVTQRAELTRSLLGKIVFRFLGSSRCQLATFRPSCKR